MPIVNNTISNLSENVNQEVTLAGWLYKSRSSGKVQFLIIRDGTVALKCPSVGSMYLYGGSVYTPQYGEEDRITLDLSEETIGNP